MPQTLYANTAQTTVSSGGTTAPAPGTVESWTVASSVPFPAASSTATPPTQFHVEDVALPGELMAVTDVSGTTWTVTRGAENSTPAAHTAGFTVKLVVSEGDFAQLRDHLDWVNAVTYLGADPTGTTDSTAAIQDALNAAGALPEPGVCYLPAGTYQTSAPLLIPAGVKFLGAKGATTSVYDALPPAAGTIIKPAAGFSAGTSPAGVVVPNGTGAHVREMWIDGSNLPAGSGISGITTGSASAVYMQNAGVYNVPNFGIDQGGATAWHLYMCLAVQCYSHGFHGSWVDSILINCHAQCCGLDGASSGFYIFGGESKFIGCRGDLSQNGFSIDAGGGGTFFDPVILSACSTQRNNHYGFNIKNNSSGGTTLRTPVVMAGCMSTGDGINGTLTTTGGGTITGGTGGGSYAAIGVQGSNEVAISGFANSVNTRDVAAGCPEYSIATYGSGTPDVVAVDASFLNAVTALTNWAPVPAVLEVGAGVTGYAGGIYTGVHSGTVPVPAPAGWQPLTLGAGWAARGAGYATPEYARQGGSVVLAGEVVGTAVGNGSTIATLPSGFYNATNSYISGSAVISGAGAPTAGQTFRLSLGNTGVLAIYGIATSGNYTVSLDGVSFPIGAP